MQATMWRCPSNNQRNLRRCIAGVVFIPLHSYHTIDYKTLCLSRSLVIVYVYTTFVSTIRILSDAT